MDLFRDLSRFKEYWLLILLAILAAALYSFFSYGLPWRFNSPDEAANAYFAQRIARGEVIGTTDVLNDVTGNPIVHPRSTHIVKGQLVPASFLGLSLILGFISRLVHLEAALPFLTPLGGLIGLLAFFGIIRLLSNKRAAWLATILLSLSPAFWYYHSRSFFHNALFLDFLLLHIYLTLTAVKSKNIWLYFLSGLALGLALALRTSEVFWLAAVGIVWFGSSWREVDLKGFSLMIIGILLSFSPILFTNYGIYGSILSFGYKQDLILTGNLQNTFGLLHQLVLPFGFHPMIILATVSKYLIYLNWWWAVLVGTGLIYLIYSWRQQTKQAKIFAITVAIMCLWLVIVYGSWQFNDNPDPQAVTLGTSYARYWLPIYALCLWPASLALSRLYKWHWGKYVIMSAIGCYAFLSGMLVWAEPQEGLAAVKNNIFKFQAWNQQVQAVTEPNSVIVTGITDKIFWPEREVIYSLVNPADYESVNKLLQDDTPVYWFHPTWLTRDLVTMNNRLSAYGLQIYPVQFGWQDFSLYKFSLLP